MNWQWPAETPNPQQQDKPFWYHESSNIVLDFHGDSVKAELVVYSDGNHYMALQEAISLFMTKHPDLTDVFYLTLPPNLLKGFVQQGAITIGNLQLSVQPHVFISPVPVLSDLQRQGVVSQFQSLFRNQGSVLLVRKNNPKDIGGVEDLLRDNVRFFISNPTTETVSFRGYRDTLLGMLQDKPDMAETLAAQLEQASSRIEFGKRIHHREAPVALVQDKCDAAVLYYHLALHYSRKFPALFEWIPLTGGLSADVASTANLTTENAIAAVGQGGPWGKRLVEFMLSEAAGRIYHSHGLLASR